MAQLDPLLKYLHDEGGSDLHVAAGAVPRIRRHGVLEDVPNQPVMEDERLAFLLRELAPQSAWNQFSSTQDAVFTYSLPGAARFRAACFRQENGHAAVFRVMAERIVPLDELRLPAGVGQFALLRSGLVLVGGPSGSGRSTTVAALLDAINRTSVRHIVTVEEPLEHVHANGRSMFSHREAGRHTNGHAAGLRAALRQDADVILAGDVRDGEAARLALAAAEAGKLVFATVQAIGVLRILAQFAAMLDDRGALAPSLAGVISQLLVRSIDGEGRVPAVELFVRTPGLVVEHDGARIHALMQGRTHGMQTMDQALQQLVKDAEITAETAARHAADRSLFERSVKSPSRK